MKKQMFPLNVSLEKQVHEKVAHFCSQSCWIIYRLSLCKDSSILSRSVFKYGLDERLTETFSDVQVGYAVEN